MLAGIAALAFMALFAFDVPFPAVIAGAGLTGFRHSSLMTHSTASKLPCLGLFAF